MDSLPSWLKLLVRQRQISFGLSLSFLFGVACADSQSDSEDKLFQRFGRFLYEVRDKTPTDFTLRISYCDNAQVPILAIVTGPQDWCVAMQSDQTRRTSLYVSPEYLDQRSPTIDSAINRLWETYRTPIVQRRYSVRNGEFSEFSKDDLRFISEVLSEHHGASEVE